MHPNISNDQIERSFRSIKKAAIQTRNSGPTIQIFTSRNI